MWSNWTTDTEATIYLSTQGSPWSIYVQSKDNAGAVETYFGGPKNHMVVAVQDDDNVPSVQVCAYRGPFSGEPTLLDCSSTDDPLSTAIDVAVGDTLCFESSFERGPYAEEVTHIDYLVNDSGIPGAWKDARVNANRFYPPSGQIYTAPLGITTIYVWVKDDYCEFGSANTAIIMIRGSYRYEAPHDRRSSPRSARQTRSARQIEIARGPVSTAPPGISSSRSPSFQLSGN